MNISQIRKTMESESVCAFKDVFQNKISELRFKVNSCSITNEENYEQIVKEVMAAKNKTKKTSLDYRRLKRYDILTVGTITKLIVPLHRSNNNEVKYFVHNDEIFDILKTAHIETGHGGLHKVHEVVKYKYANISREIIRLFISHCEICVKKRSHPKKGVVIKPMIFNEINSRGQVDLIDMQSCKDREFKFIMNYQDHLSKFLMLRPLKTKSAAEVSYHLIDIFCIFGAPSILQSDNGREFVNSVIEELTIMWPQLKIVHRKPRHSQSQGSVERANRDVEEMIRAWMIDNNSTQWSEGLRFCQYHKNNSLHSGIKQSPFEALFGRRAKLGLAGSALPTSVVEKLFSEEDVEKITRDVAEAGSSEVEKPVEVQSFTGEKKFVENEDIAIQPKQKISSQRNTSNNVEIQSTTMLAVAAKITETETCEDMNELSKVAKTAKIQNTRERRKAVCRDEARFEHKQTVLHEEANNIEEEYSVLQKVHLNIQKNQQLAISGLEEQAIRMKMHSDYKFPPIEKGTTVTIPVPDVDRSKGDLRNLIGISFIYLCKLYLFILVHVFFGYFRYRYGSDPG